MLNLWEDTKNVYDNMGTMYLGFMLLFVYFCGRVANG